MKRLAIFLASSLLAAGLFGMRAPAAFAADNQKAININGHQLAVVPGVVKNQTTYMPIWYIMKALTSLGIVNHWDGHNWTVSAGNGTPLGPEATGTAPDAIVVNGQALYKITGIVQNGTTYMPIWYIIQMLDKIGVQNTWDGKSWNITGTPQTQGSVSSSESSTNPATSSATTNSTNAPSSPKLPNAATDDSVYWGRANSDLYLMASTFSFAGGTSGPSILSTEPGATLYLTVASSHLNVTSDPQWFVNSPDATITSESNLSMTMANRQVGEGTFTATQPGIYTVQAASNGTYSEPLVIMVGIDKLTATKNLSVTNQVSGVQPMPGSLTSSGKGSVNGVSYNKYQPVNGWLPVSGSIAGTSSITVYLQSQNSPGSTWVYRLPVQNGQFSSMVRIPFTGNVVVTFFPHYNQSLTNQGIISFNDNYVVSNDVPIDRQGAALLASAEMDSNMSPVFANEASVLMTNAPTRRTGIVAINNYAAESIEYDMQDYLANKNIWHDSLTEWTLHLGVCGDIAEMAATMMKSVGVPVETVIGNAGDGLHEWLQAYNGSSWEILDPTWDAPVHSQTNEPADILSNEYNDGSPDFTASHTQTALGGWQ